MPDRQTARARVFLLRFVATMKVSVSQSSKFAACSLRGLRGLQSHPTLTALLCNPRPDPRNLAKFAKYSLQIWLSLLYLNSKLKVSRNPGYFAVQNYKMHIRSLYHPCTQEYRIVHNAELELYLILIGICGGLTFHTQVLSGALCREGARTDH